jgi:hypothetical protein
MDIHQFTSSNSYQNKMIINKEDINKIYLFLIYIYMLQNKYIRHKIKYLNYKNQYGGTFEIDETKYVNKQYTNIQDIKYLAGPISQIVISIPNYNKKIYLFGDLHTHTDNLGFECDSKSTNSNSIYFPDYLEYYLNKTTKIIDVFTELAYQSDKFVPSVRDGLINNIRKQFEQCFSSLRNKTACQQKYPNVRFHAMDIRHFRNSESYQSNEAPLIEFNNVLKTIEIWNHLYNIHKPLHKIYMLQLVNIIQEIGEHCDDNNLKKYSEIASNFYNDHSKYTETIVNIYKMLPTIFVGEHNIAIKNDIEDRLKNLLNCLLWTGKQDLTEMIVNIIRKYIGDENGFYANANTNFWVLVNTSPKLQRNLNKVVSDNFNPNLDQSMYKEFDNNFKEMLKSKKIDSEMTAYLYTLLSNIGTSLMDVYMLGRIFKQFKQKLPNDISAETADNIIIVAGHMHIKNYSNFFTKIGGNVVYEYLPKNPIMEARNRCVPMYEINF